MSEVPCRKNQSLAYGLNGGFKFCWPVATWAAALKGVTPTQHIESVSRILNTESWAISYVANYSIFVICTGWQSGVLKTRRLENHTNEEIILNPARSSYINKFLQ